MGSLVIEIERGTEAMVCAPRLFALCTRLRP